MKFISEELEKKDMSIDEKNQIIVSTLKRKAQENNIDLKLRK